MPPKMPRGAIQERKIQILKSDLLNFSWLVHGFSTRNGGHSSAFGGAALNLGFGKNDARASVEQNRAAFLRQLDGTNQWRLITARQGHSDVVHEITALDSHPIGDALITNRPGLLLAIQTADCLPLLIADAKRHAVGAVHAGWRGTLARIAVKTIGEMRRAFGSTAEDLRVAIGPGIHACCYVVGQEVREEFESQFATAGDWFREVRQSDPVREKYPLLFLHARPPGHGPEETKLYLDLVAANTQQLVEAGVRPKNIDASPLCTSCRTDLLFSYRAEKGNTGRLMGVIGLRSRR